VPRTHPYHPQAYGGAYIVMNSKHIRGDVNLAYPRPRSRSWGRKGAVNIIRRSEIEAAADPPAERQRLIADYQEKFSNPYRAAEWAHRRGDRPAETRPKLIRRCALLKTKRTPTRPRSTRHPTLDEGTAQDDLGIYR